MNSKRQFLGMVVAVSLALALFTGMSPVSAQVPTPESYLGFEPGADFHLATYEQAIGYYELLASRTDRMQVLDMGPTSMGRRMKYGVISSEENMARLDELKEINRKLSLVRDIGPEEAARLAENGRVVVWIDGGLHATEVAPAQLMVKLAYELVAGEDRQTRMIRENVIMLLVFANPDGMTIVSDWYMGNVGTPYEVSRVPELYHKYAGHDNNRDSFMSNLVETQNMNRVQNHMWFPEIVYNQHQTGPFPARIWIPPEAEPVNPNLHPIIIRWKNLIGAAMGKAFEENKQPGAISRISYDSWYPGYVTQVVEGHNAVPILTETQLYRYATPHFYTINDFPEQHRDLIKGTFYPSPWQGGWWRLGDAVDYNNTACKAVLETAAKYRYEFLIDKYTAGREVIDTFAKEPPYGWVFPAVQRDANTTALLMNRLILNGIEVYRADEPFSLDGIDYRRDSYIIPASQPFGFFAKNMLERQRYPDLREYIHLWQGIIRPVEWEGAPLRPYDGVGWTLPLQMGVKHREMGSPVDIAMTRIQEAEPPESGVTGGGSHAVFSHADNHSFTALFQILDAGGRVSWARGPFDIGGSRYPSGTFVADRGSISESALNRIARDTGVVMRGGTVTASRDALEKPRIALYKSWVANMDMGWITLIFDRFGYDYHLLKDAEVRAGNLGDRFDVIVLPDQGAESIVNGHRKGTMPPDYVGGITEGGVENLEAFVRSGGVLVCNKSSADLPVERFDLPVKNVLQDVPSDSFNCPGSILKMRYDVEHPLAFGMPERDIAFFSGGRVYEPTPDSLRSAKQNELVGELQVVARYPDESLLESGWILGEERIRDRAAVLDIPYGGGRIILFGFNVQNRAQARSTFKLLFNALYYR